MMKVAEGDIVLYRMKLEDLPVDPQRLWRGRVKQVFKPTEWTIEYYRIISLEPAYRGLREIVYPFQIEQIVGEEF